MLETSGPELLADSQTQVRALAAQLPGTEEEVSVELVCSIVEEICLRILGACERSELAAAQSDEVLFLLILNQVPVVHRRDGRVGQRGELEADRHNQTTRKNTKNHLTEIDTLVGGTTREGKTTRLESKFEVFRYGNENPKFNGFFGVVMFSVLSGYIGIMHAMEPSKAEWRIETIG